MGKDASTSISYLSYSVPVNRVGELFNWTLMSYGIWGMFNIVFLQPLSMLTLGNLNATLCPAITDPFRGPHYRKYAMVHQFVGMKRLKRFLFIITLYNIIVETYVLFSIYSYCGFWRILDFFRKTRFHSC